MAKYVVTGGAGFIGSQLAEVLATRADEVIVLDNFAGYYSRQIKERNISNFDKAKIKLVELDLATADLSNLFNNADAVFHLAAQPGISSTVSFHDYERNNVLATHRLLEAISQVPSPPRLIFASTSSVYGKIATGDEATAPAPVSYYGVTKLASEQLALAYFRDRGLPVSVARLFSVYGERERPEKLYPKLIKSILDNKPFSIFEGSLEHRRSYTYVGDAVEGLIGIMGCGDKALGEIFNIGTKNVVTTGEGIRIVEGIMGRKAKLEIVPARPGDQKETGAVIAKAERVFGYNPVTNLAEGLAREVKWFTENPI